ncbi:MAG: helix-turn-helix domain-containing protein [Neisseria sp.]|nr:helix-turn-helix domain-containing protein [Neisseria sp.]
MPDLSKKSSQTDLILAHLQQGKSLTPLEALRLFGCLRLGARVHDLRQDGYPIISQIVCDAVSGKHYASYSLNGGK